MIAFIGSGQSMKLFTIGFPIKVAGVYDCASNLCGVSVHIFCRRVGNNVTAPFKRTAVDRRGKCVIHNQWNSMLVGYFSKTFDIKHVASRVGYCFAKEAFCIRFERGLYFFVIPVGIDECAFNAHFLQGNAEKIERSTINGVGSNDVISCFTNVEHSIEIGCLA